MGGMPRDPTVYAKQGQGDVKFYNQAPGQYETRPYEQVQGLPFESHQGDADYQLRTGGGFTAEALNQRLVAGDQQRQGIADAEARNREVAEANRRAREEAARQRELEIDRRRQADISTYIDFQADNPAVTRYQSDTGKWIDAVIPGYDPSDALAGYAGDKSITLDVVKGNIEKYFTPKTSVPRGSLEGDQLILGKGTKKPTTGSKSNLLARDDDDILKKQLLGA